MNFFPNTFILSSYEPRCPICNELLMDLSGLDFRDGFGKLVCPVCRYVKIK